MGASAMAPPIAAAANHGTKYLIFVFMLFSACWVAQSGLFASIAFVRAGVVTADTRSALLLAGICRDHH
jgi:hypothetical protein